MVSITERQRTIINAIQKERTATREYLLMREKPLTAYQHYIKHMRARWNTLSEEEQINCSLKQYLTFGFQLYLNLQKLKKCKKECEQKSV